MPFLAHQRQKLSEDLSQSEDLVNIILIWTETALVFKHEICASCRLSAKDNDLQQFGYSPYETNCDFYVGIQHVSYKSM